MSPPPPRGTQKLLKNISNEISSKNAQIFTKPTEHVLKRFKKYKNHAKGFLKYIF